MCEKVNIPRVIHYCWFGGNPLPEEAKKCIESWKRYCPDYEIIRWDESNYDVNSCAYIQEAYQAKKWAFVSDYARFDILYHHGGVYFDTDVELVASIEDILEKGAFLGVEQPIGDDLSIKVAPGLGMAAEAGHPLYRQILNMYGDLHFLHPDGSPNQITVVKYTTDLLLSYGLQETYRGNLDLPLGLFLPHALPHRQADHHGEYPIHPPLQRQLVYQGRAEDTPTGGEAVRKDRRKGGIPYRPDPQLSLQSEEKSAAERLLGCLRICS